MVTQSYYTTLLARNGDAAHCVDGVVIQSDGRRHAIVSLPAPDKRLAMGSLSQAKTHSPPTR